MAKTPKKKFSEMTKGEKAVFYKKRRNACIIGKWTCIVTPFVAIFGAKFNEYFALVDSGTQLKLSIGCILAVIVGAIAVFKEVKQTATNKKVISAVGWGVAFALVFLFESILNDLVLIVGCEFVGQVASSGLDIYKNNCETEYQEYTKLARDDGTLITNRK